MAPIPADTAAASQKQARRAPVRIIPAIPRRFARPPAPARPITPDESTTAAVTQAEPEPQLATERASEERAATPVQVPLTPDSKASAVANGPVEDESGLANSPARSGDDHVEVEATDTQGLSPSHHGSASFEGRVLTTQQTDARTPQQQDSSAPAELPPEFYPHEKPESHTPSAEGIEAPFVPPATNITAHRVQPSVEGLVFGGVVQGSPAMPSTPQELEPDMRGQQQTFARPPPGFAPHLAPQFFPGHTHHPSDPAAAAWLYPAYTMAPPPESMYNGHDYHSASIPAVAPAYHAPYQGQFSPQGAPLAMNGAPRSHSQSPSKSHFGEEPQTIPLANGNVSRPQDAAQDGYDIAKHLSSLFGNPEFTDYILHIRSPDTMLLTLPVHAALVSRSPVILEALRRSTPLGFRTKDPRRLIDILTNDRFVTSESLHEALKILYAAPLLPVQSFLYGLGSYDGGSDQGYTFNEARKRMSQAISYVAAARVLQIPEMQACGLRIAKALLRWDTLEQALYFGFEAGATTIQPSAVGVDSRLLETYVVPLLDDALEFVAYNFPVDFSLHKLAPEMRHYPRLPTLVEFKQPTHNPRLSKIRFGDAPPEDDQMPSHVTQVLSTILLSLPLSLLDRLFSHPAAANRIGWSVLVQIMRDVVAERERRRQKASKGQLKPSPDGTVPKTLLENLQREERVESAPERSSGYKLTANHLAVHA
ncbi:hypothetical protein K458DRAFT_296652 [Lentithecium fluviatile CBS 122367]|uniref:Uncharacterized protein n=1 Tax=Lentithecium fluviatile CBS 122367 TaxID=1168545 RepID=A0A6G1JA74_9PLEO|nr:hypothetical protein K458DRAFT_296652 [Lentithecium fluviatile CBS 122367]